MTLKLFPGSPVEPLSPQAVGTALATTHLGHAVLHYPSIASTNDVAREQARIGMAEGLLVLAEEQTAGRGRHDRRWEAPYGSALLVSLLLRPTFLAPERAFLLTATAALAIAEGVERETQLQTTLKWPNDVLVGGRKVCGILVELEGTAGQLEWAVVGWGLNVNVDFSADEDLSQRATSLAEAAGRPFPRLPLLRACLERLETYYEALRAGWWQDVWNGWRARLQMLGREVEVTTLDKTFTGQAVDVAPDGALLVKREGGQVERVIAGDVTIRQG